MTTLAEKKHLGRVAELGCAVCRRMGHPGTPAEIHHLRAGTGAGRRSSHWEAIPLCPEHHRGNTGLHGLGTKGFPKRWGFDEDDAIKDGLKDEASLSGQKSFEGDLFKAAYIETNRSTVDWKAVAKAMNIPAELIAEHTKTAAVFSIKVTSK
jgi:hypothetical protein